MRIKSILQQVYERRPDADLVRSIELAAEDPGAIDTFYQLSLAGGRTKITAATCSRSTEAPLMLLWRAEGSVDPDAQGGADHGGRARGVRTRPSSRGDCPHDDAPAECSAKLGDWAEGLAA